MIESADVLVLGLGPAGASAAAAAARAGRKVIALDRKREAGVPVQCAELLPGIVEADPRAVRQRVDAMRTFVEDDPPDLKREFPARMLDRAAFDASLVEAARQAGADVRLGTAAKNVASDGTVHCEARALRARVIVGADGPRSLAGKAIGSVNRDLVETRQITVGLRRPYAATDIFLSGGIPGGYGWFFPKGDLANLGAGVSPQAKSRLKAIVAHLHAGLMKEDRVNASILATTGGAIPVGGAIKPWGRLGETVVLLAGDAAGLANPVTGAGIAAALDSGRLAGEAAVRGTCEQYAEELEDLLGAALARALRRRQELLESSGGRAALRRAWIAYPEYWQ